MTKTEIFLKANVDKEKVKLLCEAIAKKDPTFKYEIAENYLILFSPDKDIANKRGLLFCKKYLKEFDLGFNVK
jgi:hypothetical protein